MQILDSGWFSRYDGYIHMNIYHIWSFLFLKSTLLLDLWLVVWSRGWSAESACCSLFNFFLLDLWLLVWSRGWLEECPLQPFYWSFNQENASNKECTCHNQTLSPKILTFNTPFFFKILLLNHICDLILIDIFLDIFGFFNCLLALISNY